VTANRRHILYLLEYLAGYGISSACFDFSGHGESTGSIEKATLNSRKEEGLAAAKLLGGSEPLTIIGSSMGGHIAALVAPQLPACSLILFCPAAYPAEAADWEFNDDFWAFARRPGTWVSSPSFKALSSYRGNLLIVTAGRDALIPPDVSVRYAESAAHTRFKKVLRIEESDHKIHAWLQDHPQEKEVVLREVLAITRRQCAGGL
jgi:pimeloyl-ACP methyl ester carboxylesterase